SADHLPSLWSCWVWWVAMGGPFGLSMKEQSGGGFVHSGDAKPRRIPCPVATNPSIPTSRNARPTTLPKATRSAACQRRRPSDAPGPPSTRTMAVATSRAAPAAARRPVIPPPTRVDTRAARPRLTARPPNAPPRPRRRRRPASATPSTRTTPRTDPGRAGGAPALPLDSAADEIHQQLHVEQRDRHRDDRGGDDQPWRRHHRAHLLLVRGEHHQREHREAQLQAEHHLGEDQ